MKNTITSKDIMRAVKAIEEASKRPELIGICSNLDYEDCLIQSVDARSFCFGGGYVPYKNKEIPDGILRFEMSDGTYIDCPIKNEITYL